MSCVHVLADTSCRYERIPYRDALVTHLHPAPSPYTKLEGMVVPTCFTNNIGRVVDFCEGVVLEDSVWLLSSPPRWQRLLQTMDKFIFPMDK